MRVIIVMLALVGTVACEVKEIPTPAYGAGIEVCVGENDTPLVVVETRCYRVGQKCYYSLFSPDAGRVLQNGFGEHLLRECGQKEEFNGN